MSKASRRTIQDARRTCIAPDEKMAYALSEDGQNEAKDFLSVYAEYDDLIAEKMRMRETLLEKSKNISSFLSSVHTGGISDKTAEIAASIADLETDIAQDIDAMLDRRCVIQSVINCILEKREKAVLEMKYIEKMPIFKIAMHLHYDERTVYRMQKSALAKVAIMLLEDERLTDTSAGN